MASAARLKGPADARPADWALLVLLVAIGGSSFTFIHQAVATMPPAIIAVARLWIAAGALYLVMRIMGRGFPPLLVRTKDGLRPHRLWASMTAVGIAGYTIPFLLYPWAQQHVETGLAGVYMAIMPIATLALAYFFADEKLTPSRIGGFTLGFAGVILLMGPDVIKGAAQSSILAQGALLIANLCYAASAVLARRAPPARPIVYSAGIVLCGAILATPSLLFADLDPSGWSATSALSIVVLGLVQTAAASITIITVIRRAGASFMALANYLTPVVAILLGALIFHERLQLSVFIALGAIFAGVTLSRRKAKPAIASPLAPIAESAAQKSS